jgi:LacI family transcriptional regulator
MTAGRPTMNDVARSAGVSLKTVSRVVNGETTVDPALAARVREAVAALRYRPNLGASMLRRNDHRTRIIGLLLAEVGTPFSAMLHRAVEDAARVRGLHVLTAGLAEEPEREQELVQAFAQRQTEGLILAPTGPDQGHLEAFTGMPVVFVDRPAVGIGGDTVTATNVAGAAEAVRHLIAHGHRQIAYLGDHQRLAPARDRHHGYLQALGGRAGPVVHDLHDPAAADHATMSVLRRSDPPSAIFAGQSVITIGALRALRRLGRHRSVALVGFDDFPLADLLEPGITVIAQDAAGMGRAAARALFERMDGNTAEPREISIATTLIPRGSGEITGRPTGSW